MEDQEKTISNHNSIFKIKNYLINCFYVKNWSGLNTLTKQQMCI